ncbi:hypothetical protein EV130_102208 [Rhizobium azibense]|uniref:Uncharacterized protein n=1 Tax=Rhizobium azibense TaxID=1136135 RepID=A0A4R3R234_9HYPH|nr:hypothetical protein EV130_102208 [Rhizobium azibense]
MAGARPFGKSVAEAAQRERARLAALERFDSTRQETKVSIGWCG